MGGLVILFCVFPFFLMSSTVHFLFLGVGFGLGDVREGLINIGAGLARDGLFILIGRLIHSVEALPVDGVVRAEPNQQMVATGYHFWRDLKPQANSTVKENTVCMINNTLDVNYFKHRVEVYNELQNYTSQPIKL